VTALVNEITGGHKYRFHHNMAITDSNLLHLTKETHTNWESNGSLHQIFIYIF